MLYANLLIAKFYTVEKITFTCTAPYICACAAQHSWAHVHIRPPHVSLLFDLILPLLKRLTLVGASTIASCVSELVDITSKSSGEENEMFLARIEWLPVTSRSHTGTSRTDKCKISIMIAIIHIHASIYTQSPRR